MSGPLPGSVFVAPLPPRGLRRLPLALLDRWRRWRGLSSRWQPLGMLTDDPPFTEDDGPDPGYVTPKKPYVEVGVVDEHDTPLAGGPWRLYPGDSMRVRVVPPMTLESIETETWGRGE